VVCYGNVASNGLKLSKFVYFRWKAKQQRLFSTCF